MYVVEKSLDGWSKSRPWGIRFYCPNGKDGYGPLNLTGETYRTKKAAQAVADKVNTLI